MDFGKYVESLLPSLGKDRVLEDIRNLREELQDTVIPPYASATEFFKQFKFQDKTTKDLAKDFERTVKTKYRGDMVAVLSQVWGNSVDGLDELDRLVDKYYGTTVTATGMTFLKANVLQHVEAMGFAFRYARRLLMYLYALETQHYSKDGDKVTGSFLTKPEREWMQVHYRDFLHVINILAIPAGDLGRIYGQVPDALIEPERVEEMKATMGTSKVDPLKHGFIPSALWPLYHVRIRIAEWQVARRDAAREEVRAMEFRLLNLKNQTGGQSNARIEQEIAYSEDRISKLNRKIAKLEEG
jgi:hypothetical protein